MVSNKCLQEVNRLRQMYRPHLPQYSAPTNQGGTQKSKIKMEGACTSELSNPPKPKRIRTESKKPCSDRDKARNSKVVKRNPIKLIRCPTHPDYRLKLPVNRQNVNDRYRFNPVSEEW